MKHHHRTLAAALFVSLTLAGGGAFAAATLDEEPTANIKQAQTQIDAANFEGAIKTLSSILESKPDDADANNLMGFSLRKSGKWKDAETYYLKALAKNPKHLGANEYLGELYAERGDLGKANERLQVLRDACGTCEQAEDLAKAIAAANKGK